MAYKYLSINIIKYFIMDDTFYLNDVIKVIYQFTIMIF